MWVCVTQRPVFFSWKRSRCAFFCSSSSCTRRDYRDGVLPGLGFFTCGAFVTHPALRPTSDSGRGQNKKSPTQIWVPLSACGLLGPVSATLYNFYQVTLLISVFSLVFGPLIFAFFPIGALTSLLWCFKNSPASINTLLLHSRQHWLFADFFFFPSPLFALLMYFTGSSSATSQFIFTR